MAGYESVQALVDRSEKEGCRISELCLREQAEEMGETEESLFRQMEKSYDIMRESMEWWSEPGRRSVSGLTGGEGFRMLQYAEKGGGLMGSFMTKALGRALSVSNCNAAMGRIVAAPTAGSCGILPGCLISMQEDRGIPKREIVLSLFTAAALGMIIAKKAGVSGAQGGCQAECGSAAAMAAAALTELMGGSPEQCAAALGIALVNQMGLVCDPVAGLVEIPCIKRNAAGVVTAFSAADMALSGIPLYIPADECIAAMKAVGDSMPESLKETALGGLAASPTGKRMHERLYGKKPEKERLKKKAEG